MRCYIFEATEFHNNIYRSDMSYLGYEQANLSYENQQKGIQAPQKHKTKETRFAILMSFELRDHENETREQVTSFSRKEEYSQRFSQLEYWVRYLPELIHPNRVVHLQRKWKLQLGIEKHEGAEKSGTNLYKPTVM
ncbi:hypothetical protein H5410_013539, partial [Solanum commersonii]